MASDRSRAALAPAGNFSRRARAAGTLSRLRRWRGERLAPCGGRADRTDRYSGRGAYGDGDFWSGIVFSDERDARVSARPGGAAEEAAPFRIAAIGHIWGGHGLTGNGNPPPPDAKAQSKTKNPGGKPVAGKRGNWLAGRLFHPKTQAARSRPDRPADFRLGPVAIRRFSAGSSRSGWRSPPGAARVALDLAAVNPAVDVDLYVRFGRDNELQDGQVVRDHSSRGPSGNERIVITRYSNPPLQTGTWFVSLLLYDTNAAAEGTLTATLGFDEEPPPVREVGGPLTPGQPAAFRLGPVGSSTLFNGEFSFRLEVPADAARVTFDLTAVDPAVDVDIYVVSEGTTSCKMGRLSETMLPEDRPATNGSSLPATPIRRCRPEPGSSRCCSTTRMPLPRVRSRQLWDSTRSRRPPT